MIQENAQIIVGAIEATPPHEREQLIDLVATLIVASPAIDKIEFKAQLFNQGVNATEVCKRKTPPAP